MPRFNAETKHFTEKSSSRALDAIEWAGNKLPEPLIIFLWLIGAIVALSAALAAAGVSVVHPDTGDTVEIRSLLTSDGVQFALDKTVSNFTGFSPVGMVLTLMIGIGLADRTGLLDALVRATLLRTPAWLLPFAVFFVANNSMIASDAGYLLVPPLAAIVYRTLGRHPLVGIIVAFVGCSTGYASGLVITAVDPILAGLSTEAAGILGTGIEVSAADNYYFYVASMVGCLLVCGVITRWVVEPRLGPYQGDHDARAEPVTTVEKRGLLAAGTVGLIYVGILVAAALVTGSPLQNDEGGLVPSPLLSGIVPLLFLFFVLVGLTYGIAVKDIRSSRDVSDKFVESIRNMSSFLVVVFFIAQFSAYFNWTNVGLWISVNGADFLEGINANGFGVLIGVTVVSGAICMVVTSGSGLWAILAPVLIPMLMQVGFHPAAVQMAYRMGDASSNMITPLMPYMVVVLGFMRQWEKDTKLGNLIANTIPYAIGVFAVQILLFAAFYALGIPLGPGVGFRLE